MEQTNALAFKEGITSQVHVAFPNMCSDTPVSSLKTERNAAMQERGTLLPLFVLVWAKGGPKVALKGHFVAMQETSATGK